MATPTVYLLDTNILVHLIRGRGMAAHLQARYGLNTILADPVVSVISCGEVLSFARQRGWGKGLLSRMQHILDQFEPLDINHPAIIEAYADIDATSHSLGYKMGKNDVWLAATAQVLRLPFLTTDKDFNHLNGSSLDVVWVDPTMGKGS